MFGFILVLFVLWLTSAILFAVFFVAVTVDFYSMTNVSGGWLCLSYCAGKMVLYNLLKKK